MSSILIILFYGKTSKTTKEGLLPIYLRVTISGKRFEVAREDTSMPPVGRQHRSEPKASGSL